MTAFALRTEEEEVLGFLLFAKHEGDRPPAGPNDCVLAGGPVKPSLLSDPRASFIRDHKGSEWTAEVSYEGSETTVRIAFSTGWNFESRSHDGGGRWWAERAGKRLEGSGAFVSV